MGSNLSKKNLPKLEDLSISKDKLLESTVFKKLYQSDGIKKVKYIAGLSAPINQIMSGIVNTN